MRGNLHNSRHILFISWKANPTLLETWASYAYWWFSSGHHYRVTFYGYIIWGRKLWRILFFLEPVEEKTWSRIENDTHWGVWGDDQIGIPVITLFCYCTKLCNDDNESWIVTRTIVMRWMRKCALKRPSAVLFPLQFCLCVIWI